MAMSGTIYLGRDNKVRLALTIDDVVINPAEVTITAAELYVPGIAFSDGVAVTYSTADNLELVESGTAVDIDLGHESTIIPGRYTCKLTLFDGVDVEGLAWTEELINFKDWRV